MPKILRTYLHVWRSKRYTIWGRESILYFVIRMPCHPILNTRLPNSTKVTDCIMEWSQPSLFFFIERQGKERQMLRPCNWRPWLSCLGGYVTCKHYAAPLCEILNEWVASNRIVVYFWDRHGANIATQLKEMYGERLFRRPKKKILEIIAFSPLLYQKWIRVMLVQGKSKFLFEKPCNMW